MTIPSIFETSGDDPLNFFVRSPDGHGYRVDLTEFADGGCINQVAAKARHAWAGDFRGRPVLAREFAEMVREEQPSEKTSRQWRWGLRQFFRFLDSDEAKGGPAVTQLADITDAHGSALVDWLGAHQNFAYRRAKAAIDAMCLCHGRRKPFWPARDQDNRGQQEPLSRAAARALFNALKAEARDLKRMFREGAALADAGGPLRVEMAPAHHWARPHNRAWLVRDATSDGLVSRDALKSLGVYWTLINFPGPGPSYLAPLMGERGETGWAAALRWHYPGYQDMAVFLWLFLLATGWNLSTALSIDVSRPESWCEPHPQNPAFAVIHAWKQRSSGHQFTLALTKPEFHPYQIMIYIIDRTKVLRGTVQGHLDRARAEHEQNPSDESAAKVAELEATVRSPWLYQLSNKLGAVSAFDDRDSSHFGPIAREIARRHDLLDAFPELEEIATSDARDAWIGYAYIESGHHLLIAQLAAQHKNLATLRHYLKSVLYRMRSEAEVRKLQAALFKELGEGRIIDPVRLRILVANGSITREQEDRLKDLRQRTRLGMGCIDPTAPPREIAPDHKSGSVCRVQRCTGCQHGLVFAESLDLLARAYAELIQIRRTIPFVAWAGSSFEEEFSSVEETLKHFDPGDVRERVDAWTKKFETGEARIHDTYPSY
ncbi:hypothetical protein [Bradyrhizobium japonicum]|uniref:hypothetical protein n=1 Tax=Bradyrhizobium japonicum TaxID=375 RepID=UPI0035174EDC